MSADLMSNPNTYLEGELAEQEERCEDCGDVCLSGDLHESPYGGMICEYCGDSYV